MCEIEGFIFESCVWNCGSTLLKGPKLGQNGRPILSDIQWESKIVHYFNEILMNKVFTDQPTNINLSLYRINHPIKYTDEVFL